MIENVSNFDDESWGPKAEKLAFGILTRQ